MKKVRLLLLLVLFGCSKDNRDNSQGDIPQDTIVSAFLDLIMYYQVYCVINQEVS